MDAGIGRTSPVGLDQEHSRRRFLKTAASVGAALAAAGIGGASVFSRYADAQALPTQIAYPTYQGLGDVAIFSFALQLERLEGTFYALGADSGLFSGPDLAQIAAIRDHELAHADFLTTTLQGVGAPVPPVPNFTLPPDALGSREAFLGLAATLEPVGIGAYQGAAPAIENKALLGPALSIHNAECQHRCAINILQGIVPPNNIQFEQSLTFQEVAAAAAPFGVTP